jgi:hypothetical protein
MKRRLVPARPWAAIALTIVALVLSPAAQAQVKLEYKFPEGQKLTYKLTQDMSQVLKLAGQAFPTDEERTQLTSWTFGKKRDNATQPIAQKVEAFATKLSVPGGIDIAYDSKDPNAKVDHPQLSYLNDVYKLLGGLEYTVVLDAQNKVKTIEGNEKVLEKTEKLDEKAKLVIREAVDSEHLKDEFEENHGNFPEGLVRPGESWDRTETLFLGNGQTLTFRKRYEYGGTEKRGEAMLDKIIVKISEVKYGMDQHSPSPLKLKNSDLKIISGEGLILFDREAGRVVVAKEKTQIKGPMTFQSGEQEIPAELDWTLDTVMELQPGGR